MRALRRQKNHAVISPAVSAKSFFGQAALVLGLGLGLPVAADIVADPAADPALRPRVDATASGLPLVQITAPSGAGVSRNQYQTFSVDPSGAILNNARTLVSTQLGGYVEGNPNLAGGSARVILNEVTSSNPSLLRGFTEIAGSRAELVLANPNGITCNGCGFINASRGVLTTGAPQLDADGALDGFRVDGGLISIEGAGLNARSTDQVDLLARAVSVNAELWAGQLNVVTGRNQISYSDLAATALGPDANRPALAIDVGALGGMYANRIRLVGTEAGVGVASRGTLAAAAGEFTLTNAGQIVLSGQTVASGNVSIATPDSFSNQGAVISQNGALSVTAASILNDGPTALLGATGNIDLSAPLSVSNRGGAIVYSFGDLTIAGSGVRDAAGLPVDRTASLFNESSRIEAEGRLNLWADQVTNTKRVLQWTADVPVSQTALPNEPAVLWSPYHSGYKTVTETVTEDRITQDSPAAEMLAGGALTINTTAGVLNRYSTIAAGGDLAINGSVVDPLAPPPSLYQAVSLNLNRTVTRSGNLYMTRTVRECRFRLGVCFSYRTYDVTDVIPYADPSTYTNIGGSYAALTTNGRLTAGGGSIVNELLNPGGSILGGVAASLSGNPNLSLDANGLFQLSGSPDAAYLIETNPLFADYRQFISSDYMLNKLGVDFVATQKRIGDGFYEQKLVQDQVLQLTGRRFLAGYGNNETQYLALMDAGLDYAQRFNLAPGIALSAGQMAALTHDIVWLERRTVAGREVLVPVVHLSRTREQDLDAFGPLIAGGEVDIRLAGDLANQGQIHADRALSLSAANVNNQGSIRGGDVQIAADADIVNTGGHIAGDSVALSAGRDLRIDTATETQSFGAVTNTVAQHAGRVEAARVATLSAGRDVTVSGADVASGDALAIQAGRDLKVDAVAERQHVAVLFRDSHYERDQTTQRVSNLSAAGHLSLGAGNQLALQGAQVAAGGDLDIAGADITVAAVRNRALLDTQAGRGLGNYVRARNDDETVVASQLTAGGNLTLTARGLERADAERAFAPLTETEHGPAASGRVTIEGSRLAAAGQLAVAAGDVTVQEAREHHEALSEERDGKKGLLKSSSSYTRTRETADFAIGSELAGGTVSLSAGRDLTLRGAQVTGSGDVSLNAGNDVNVLAATSTYERDYFHEEKQSGVYFSKSQGEKNDQYKLGYSSARAQSHNNEQSEASASSVVGSTQGSVFIDAGRDYFQVGSNLAAAEAVKVSAERIAIEAARNNYRNTSEEQRSQKGFSATWLNSANYSGALDVRLEEGYEKSNTRLRETGNTVTASAIQASDIRLNAHAGDLTLRGASLEATNSAKLQAAGNVTVATATADSQVEYDQNTKSRKGTVMLDGSGYGIFKSEQRGGMSNKTKRTDTHNQSDSRTHAASTIAAGAGGVWVEAGEAVAVAGSEIRSGGDLAVEGSEVAVSAVTNTEHSKELYKEIESGLTLSASSPILDLIDKAMAAKKRSEQVEDDRLKRLYQVRAARSTYEAGKSVYDAYQQAAAGGGAGGFNITVSLSYGVDRKEIRSESENRDALGSSLIAQSDLALRALGVDPDTGNLNVIGSSLEAQNIALQARNDINLFSAEEYSRFLTENKSSSSSVGVNVSFGTNGFTVGVSASAARAKGKENTENLSHLETQVTARDTLALASGDDTTLKGAQARGRRIEAQVGGDLNLASEQDSERYLSKQESQSASGGFGIGAGVSVNVAVSASKSKTNSSYLSVQEQTGLFAGEDGFDIDVAGNTDLKGAVIASRADAEKNRLSTGTLSFSDIENTADYSAKSSSFSAGFSTSGGLSILPPSNSSKSDSTRNTTRAAIAQGTIDIRDRETQQARTGQTIEATLAKLSRDPDSAHQALGRIFDKQAVAESQELVKVFAEEAFKTVGDIAEHYRKPYSDAVKKQGEAAQYLALKDKQENGSLDRREAALLAELERAGYTDADIARQAYRDASADRDKYQYLDDRWGEGSPTKIAMHAFVGALQAKLAGASGGAGAFSAGAAEASRSLTANLPKDLQQWASLAVGTAAAKVSGAKGQDLTNVAQIALDGEKYNRQLHPREYDRIGKLAKELARKNTPEGATAEQLAQSERYWQGLLESEAVAMVDNQAQADRRHYVDDIIGTVRPGTEGYFYAPGYLTDIATARSALYQNSGVSILGSDGKPLISNGAPLSLFAATPEQRDNHDLFAAGPAGSLRYSSFVWENRNNPNAAAEYEAAKQANRNSLLAGQAEIDERRLEHYRTLNGSLARNTIDLDIATLAVPGSKAALSATERLVARVVGKAESSTAQAGAIQPLEQTLAATAAKNQTEINSITWSRPGTTVPQAEVNQAEIDAVQWSVSQRSGAVAPAADVTEATLGARTQALLDGAPGVNFTSRVDGVKYRFNIAGGKEGAGTALTDLKAFEDVIGQIPTSGNKIVITPQQAADLEKALGLPTGRVQQGGTISVVEDIAIRAPRSPVSGNSLFLGGGKGLPGGGPEINVAPINTAGGGGIRQIAVEVKRR